MYDPITQFGLDGSILVASLPEPLRTQIVLLTREQSIDWLVEGDEISVSFESFWILSYWCGLNIETLH